MRRVLVLLAIVTVVGAGTALAGDRLYGFSISASSTDPFVNNPPNPGSGLVTLYLWMLDANNPNGSLGAGWAAAEFRIDTTTWPMKSFRARDYFIDVGSVLDIGAEPDETGKNFLLAAGGCPTTRRVIGDIVMIATGEPVSLEFGVSSDFVGSKHWAVVVECDPYPAAYEWPEFVRFVGYATEDFGNNQDEGAGPLAVEPSTWGGVKALYR